MAKAKQTNTHPANASGDFTPRPTDTVKAPEGSASAAGQKNLADTQKVADNHNALSTGTAGRNKPAASKSANKSASKGASKSASKRGSRRR